MRSSRDRIVGSSPEARALRRFVELAAGVDSPVLLTGETGTGKSLIARLIHRSGSRATRPFVAVNCAAVPASLFESEFFGHEKGAFTGAHRTRAGFFEEAHTGTLLLDEIGDLSASHQAKLLTVLEDRVVRRVGGSDGESVDVRVISATSRDLACRLRDGRFRRDLFHRIAVLRCSIPPLRERPEDIAAITQHLLSGLTHRLGKEGVRLSDRARAFIRTYSWPGNVRELAHALEAGLVMAPDGVLAREHLNVLGADLAGEAPDVMRAEPAGGIPDVVEAEAVDFPSSDDESDGQASRYSFYGGADEERAAIRAALERARGNKTAAARALGMSRSTLRSKIRRFDL